MSALGDTFRTARESQGLSLADVAERSHIRSVFLAAIEAEDWHAIGPPVYVRGFVRTYARCLGLDADAAVARIAETASGGAAAAFAPAVRGEPPASGRARADVPKRGLSLVAIAGVIVACGLVLLAGYQYVDYRRGAPLPVNASRSAGTPTPPGQRQRAGRESRHSALAATELRPTVRTADRASSFGVRLGDSSWVRVVVDGKVAMEGVYTKGTARRFAGRSVTVRVGNAGGVSISVGGKDLGPMGGLGDVAERSFQL